MDIENLFFMNNRNCRFPSELITNLDLLSDIFETIDQEDSANIVRLALHHLIKRRIVISTV